MEVAQQWGDPNTHTQEVNRCGGAAHDQRTNFSVRPTGLPEEYNCLTVRHYSDALVKPITPLLSSAYPPPVANAPLRAAEIRSICA